MNILFVGRRYRWYLLGSLLVLLVLFPLTIPLSGWWRVLRADDASYRSIEVDETWSGTYTLPDNFELSIERGATVTVASDTKILFGKNSRLTINGTLVARGTKLKPISLDRESTFGDRDSYMIVIGSAGAFRLENASVSGGGKWGNVYMVDNSSNKNRSDLMPTADASFISQGVIQIAEGGKLDAEEVLFKNNPVAVQAEQPNQVSQVKIWRSEFRGNDYDVITATAGNDVDARYNYWGDADGPGRDDSGNLEKIIGRVDFSDWATDADMKDPVVVVPGLFGSWAINNPDMIKLDPVFGTYDDLIATFEKNGYKLDENLFLLPYNWRASNVDTAKLLKAKITEIKTQTHWPKVDVVAHSMGGIVAREYIEGTEYANDVDQLVLLGSPNRGAPKGYLIWDGGSYGSGMDGFFINFALSLEAQENGYADLFDYVRRGPILSARELLPIDNYLKDSSSGNMRTYYTDSYPRNTLLEALNTPEALVKLDASVQVTNVVGDTGSDGTLTTLKVGKPSIHLLDDHSAPTVWEHGEPDGYNNLTGDHGLVWGAGDGTVPDASVRSIPAIDTVEVSADHSSLPTAARMQVYQTLTGALPTHDIKEESKIDAILGFFVHSPVDIVVVAPDGKQIGKNFVTGKTVNEIPHAFYTGVDTKTEFVTILNPQAGKYMVKTQGTGNGDFRVESVNISQGDTANEAEESTVNFTGTTTKDQEQAFALVLNDDKTVTGVAEDTLAPTTTASITGTQGKNGWYTSDVTITLTATDNENGSGVDSTQYSLDNGTTWNAYTQPIEVTQEGITKIQYR
ncbi:MAG: hypothetical protein WCG84_04535, partial [Candidatus Moraniibacteriota bacterium]